MLKINYRYFTGLGLAAAVLASTSGCEQLPGSAGQQGAAIGGVGGAATGAIVGGEHHRLLGALLGGALGAGGGYLIGANKDRIMGRDTAGAETAVRNAQAHPATPQQALNSTTADLNGDGFVTMDEVVAMRQAGLADQQILDRMRSTGQVFELNPEQQSYLRNNGVDQYVVDQIPQLNREVRDNLLNQPTAPAPAGAPVYQQPPQSYPQQTYPQTTYPPTYVPGQPPVQPPPVQPAPPPSNPSLDTPVPPPPGL
ncbi:MAG TPA: glycine zipper domain-containing protein [Patescibacteria group bacterium]|nr:glycine zipper domain-containing protein [Patescibacteria group bacterium]